MDYRLKFFIKINILTTVNINLAINVNKLERHFSINSFTQMVNEFLITDLQACN